MVNFIKSEILLLYDIACGLQANNWTWAILWALKVFGMCRNFVNYNESLIKLNYLDELKKHLFFHWCLIHVIILISENIKFLKGVKTRFRILALD